MFYFVYDCELLFELANLQSPETQKVSTIWLFVCVVVVELIW